MIFRLVDRRAEIKARSRLADDGAEEGIGRERPALVQHRGYGFFSKPVVPSFIGVMEKIEDGGILHVAKRLRAIRRVREEFRQGEDGHGPAAAR